MVKIKALVLIILIPFLLIGCATTPEEKEYQKNRAIVNSAIMEGKLKPIIKPVQAVILDTIRR